MNIIPTKLSGCLVIEPTVFKDDRGFFMESFNTQRFQEKTGLSITFVQDNLAQSQYGVVRGLHRQLDPYAQSKLVSVIQGEIIDVAVDVRDNSPTFGQWVAVQLNEDNKHQIFVPKGFLHGYAVLSETAIVTYKCDAYYHKESESGINPLDNTLAIDWGIPSADMILSEKDITAPSFKEKFNI